MKAINITNAGTRWRVFEEEKIRKHFGDIMNLRIGDVTATKYLYQELLRSGVKAEDITVFWRPNSDHINKNELEMMMDQAEVLKDCHSVNDPTNYLNSHAKEKAFEVWDKSEVRCPKHIVIEDNDTFIKENTLSYPFLIRLNNEVTGRGSYLVNNEEELRQSLGYLESDWKRAVMTNHFTKRIAVEFVDATKEEGKYNLSYRIIVAGDKVITGYARLSEAKDWVAITGKFKTEMQDSFVKYQKRCQEVIENNHDTICNAVKSLGLNHQGVDIIENQDGELYFLECQPGYSTGYSDWPKPFYNPHYPELVSFLTENEERLKEEIPMYYNKWLNKEALFEEVFHNLKRGKQ